MSINNFKQLDYLEKVASNICRFISSKTIEKYRYFITFLDKKLRFLNITLLRIKNKAL